MSDLAGAAPSAVTFPGPDGRPSWWSVIGHALLASLVLLAGHVALLVVLTVAPVGGLDAVAARHLSLGDPGPPFDGAPLANAAAGVLVLLAGAAALRLTTRSRSGEPVAYFWAFAAAAPWLVWDDGLLAAVVTLVVLRQAGFQDDGSPRPAPLPRGAVLAAAAALALGCLALVVARTWADPITIPPGYGWDPVLAPVRATDLAPADRARGAGVLRVPVENASLRRTTVTSVRLDSAGLSPAPRVVGLRRHRGGTWKDGDPVYLPAQPVRLAPGDEAMLTVLVAGRCRATDVLDVRVGTTTGTSPVRLRGVRNGLRCR